MRRRKRESEIKRARERGRVRGRECKKARERERERDRVQSPVAKSSLCRWEACGFLKREVSVIDARFYLCISLFIFPTFLLDDGCQFQPMRG